MIQNSLASGQCHKILLVALTVEVDRPVPWDDSKIEAAEPLKRGSEEPSDI
jgi:hypothetical protein